MTDRERLIELLSDTTTEQVFCTSDGKVVSRYWCRAVADEDVAYVADHLIANGVTVQKRGEWREELVKRCDWKGRKREYYQPNSCSVCHTASVSRFNYCPNCGAYMKGKEE